MNNIIIRSTILIILATFVNRLTSFIRENVIAYYFGASAQTDAFLLAFMIPDTLVVLLSSGALSAALVVLLSDSQTKNNAEHFNSLINTSFIAVTIASAFLTALGSYYSLSLVKKLGWGFSENICNIAVNLNKIMFPTLFILSIAGVFIGIQYSKNSFLPATLAPIATNICIVIAACIYNKKIGIRALALGVLVGALLQLLIFFFTSKPFLREYRFSFKVDFEKLKLLVKTAVPISLTLSLQQGSFIVNRLFATSLSEGSLAVFNYACQIYFLPIGLFGLAISNSIYPTLCISIPKTDKFLNTLKYGLNLSFLSIMPVTFGILAINDLLIKVLYQRGAFDSIASQRTSEVLAVLALGIIAQVLLMVFIKAFHAAKDTKWPLFSNLLAVGMNIVLNIYLIKYDLKGIAISMVISSFFAALILIFISFRQLGFSLTRDIIFSFLKCLINSAFMAGAILVLSLLSRYLHLGLMTELALKIIIGMLIYLGLSLISNLDLLKSYFFKGNNIPGDTGQ